MVLLTVRTHGRNKREKCYLPCASARSKLPRLLFTVRAHGPLPRLLCTVRDAHGHNFPRNCIFTVRAPTVQVTVLIYRA